jgi:hypothetical protein
MTKWLAPVVGAAALAVAVAVGAVIWTQQGSGGSCDRAALAAALGDGIRAADEQAKPQFAVARPDNCTEDDLASVLPEVTRNWHMMPGGLLMREASHTDTTP